MFAANTLKSSKCEGKVALFKPFEENECEKAHGVQFKEASKRIMTRECL